MIKVIEKIFFEKRNGVRTFGHHCCYNGIIRKTKEDSVMTSEIGFYFVILVLVMIPLVFLGAGRDTTRQRAERKQRQVEALLDWTDKDILHGEEPHIPERVPAGCIAYRTVEIQRIVRENAGKPAA